MYAYVGSRTTRERNACGDGISIFRVGDDAGLTLIDVVGDLVNPSYLALNQQGDRLYAVHGDCTDISAFRINAATGGLTLLNRQHTGGRNPVHLALSPDGRHVIVSNHVTSNLAVLPLREDGSLGEYCQLLQLDGPLGPHRIEQQMSKPHFNPFDRSGNYVLVPDKGLDRTFSFRFEQGRLVPTSQQFTVAREGAGPRHLAFHPFLDMVYVVNELDSTVTASRWQNGELTPLQVLSMLPSSYTGNSRAAAVQVDALGRYLYASNRGHDSIAVFAIAADSGLLAFQCAESCHGQTPRFFTLSPGGRHMYVLNEDSDAIVVMEVVASSGQLRPAGFKVACGSPVCMVFSA